MSPANTLISNQGDRLLVAASGGGDGSTVSVTVSKGTESQTAMEPGEI